MIKFADEMTEKELLEAGAHLLNLQGISEEYIADMTYRMFQRQFPEYIVSSKYSSSRNGSERQYQAFGYIESVTSKTISWESTIGDSNCHMAYIRAQLYWLMPEGFDFQD